MSFTLPRLEYAYNALEPYIDARTMEIHHTKHHQAYVTKLNAAIAGSYLEKLDLLELIKQIDTKSSPGVRNNGGGVYNHNLFWKILGASSGGDNAPGGVLKEKIDLTFESFANFKEKFAAAAAGQFGSGWAWLGVKSDKSLCICTTANQDNPLMRVCGDSNNSCTPCTPIMGLDVWEHAYYLQYQNLRPKYIEAFWSVVNWAQVEKNFIAV